ncbi:MAG TPA: hypothetical protein VK604_25305 [Bryobacteraceae bacterium]|nr:hypothetical protein [Bryobacteraceae bacterium]
MRARNVKDWPFSHPHFFDLRNGATRTFESFSTVLTTRTLIPKPDGTPGRARVQRCRQLAPERNLAVIDQILAAKAFPNEPSPNEFAVGKRILIRLRTPEPEWVQIIGVVAQQRNTSLADPGREEVFFTDGFLRHGFANR